MRAAKSVCLTADDRFRRMLTIRMKQCAGVTVDYEQNPFFFFSPKCRKYGQLLMKTFLCGVVIG